MKTSFRDTVRKEHFLMSFIGCAKLFGGEIRIGETNEGRWGGKVTEYQGGKVTNVLYTAGGLWQSEDFVRLFNEEKDEMLDLVNKV